MKIDFSAILLDLDDKPIPGKDGPATLAFVSSEALLAPDQTQTDGAAKAKRFNLALQVVKGGEQEITPEDATEIKACIGRVYPPLIVGRAYGLLNG